MVTVIMSNVVLMVEVTALRAYANFLIARVPKVATAFSGSPLDAVSICLVGIIGASLSEPHNSETFVGSSFYEYKR